MRLALVGLAEGEGDAEGDAEGDGLVVGVGLGVTGELGAEKVMEYVIWE
jgi:hypothetical protein